MKRWCGACLLLCVLALPARAHFVWIVPDQGGGALVVFSDNTLPDAKVPVTKIAGTELFVVGAGGKTAALKATQEKDAYRVAAPSKGRPAVIGGVCRYGVVQKGKAEPFLLVYCAKALVGGTLQDAPDNFGQPTPQLPLEIVLIEGRGKARLLWQGKPLAGAEVAVLPPGESEATEGKTDDGGVFTLARPKAAGVYALRARHVVAKAGEQGGKKYTEVRYYSTLTFPVRAAGSEAQSTSAGSPKADSEATRLLREARAARVNWEKFPGFSADLEYNHNGKVVRGRVEVSAEGRVKLDLPDDEAKKWATMQLRSVVAHRMDNSADLNTPCAFLDDNTQHPLGRAVRVLNDELHSSYRIRDRQIIEVNRHMKDSRFSITVLHNYVTAEKKYLPASYVVNTWATTTKGNEMLRSSTAFHQKWHRVGAFDLPETLLVVTATGVAQTGAATRTRDSHGLRLTNHKLTR
jgi:uncharacterized GH25 family protein